MTPAIAVTEPDAPILVRARRQSWVREHLGIIGVVTLIAIACVAFTASSPYFLSFANFSNILRQQAPTIIIAVGVTFVITTKGIDLSVGSLAALGGCTGAAVATNSSSPWLALMAMLAVGVAAGALNGWFIAYKKVPAFIVTLAGFTAFPGLALLITGGGSIPVTQESLLYFGQGEALGLPVPALIALIVVGLGWLVHSKTRFGMRVVAAGSNTTGARRSGVPTQRILMAVYVIAGASAALAGLIIAGRLGAGSSNVGQTLALEVVTAVVLGGTSLFGGRGSVIGSALGAVLLGVISNGLTLLQMNPFYIPIVQGAILLAALWAQSAVGLQRADDE